MNSALSPVDKVFTRPVRSSITRHFWVSTAPFCSTTLFLSPSLCSSQLTDQVDGEEYPGATGAHITVFDPDGACINEVRFDTPAGEIGVLELENYLGYGKLESGLRYAHVAVTCPQDSDVQCRVHTKGGAALLGAPTMIDAKRSAFFPVTFMGTPLLETPEQRAPRSDEPMSSKDSRVEGPAIERPAAARVVSSVQVKGATLGVPAQGLRTALVTLVNTSEEDAQVKCRLYYGKRMPEVLCRVPAYGARFISMEASFPEYCHADPHREVQGYVRLTTRSNAQVGAQFLERFQVDGGGVFTGVS